MVLVEHHSKLDITSKQVLILDIHKVAMSPTFMDISQGNNKVIGSDQ